MVKKKEKDFSGRERRRSERMEILGTFSVFLIVPKKGIHRLTIQDVSELGIRFDLDVEGEDFSTFKIKEGESLDIHFYLNQSLFLPLKVKVARVEEGGEVRRIGAEYLDTSSKSYKGLISFLKMLGELDNAAQIVAG